MTPRIRQSIYLLGTVLSSVTGIALLWGGLSADTAHSVTQLVAGLVALVGGAAPAVAAKTVGKQINEGAFNSTPADQVIAGVQAVIQASVAAQSDVERVKAAVDSAISEVPVLGPLAKQAIDSIKF